MWMMGVSMALSYSNLENKASKSNMPLKQFIRELYWKAVKRSSIFFALGLFLSNGFDYGKWRIPGVLQYFAISYFLVAFTVLSCYEKTIDNLNQTSKLLPSQSFSAGKSNMPVVSGFKDGWAVFICYRYEWIIQAAILLIFLFVCLLGTAPGCPVGYNGPGGISQDSDYPECTGGIHRYIDDLLFSVKHFYK
jgi:heparan-alpha-glucosaminide N-acetyltransferase